MPITSTKTPNPKTVIIVGAGPAGGLLAFLLAREGIPVTLIERHSDFARVFRGEGLMPSGQEMFRQAGLWQQFNDLPHNQLDHVNIFYKKDLLINQSFTYEKDSLAPRFVSQPHMLDMLVSECQKFSNFTFLKGVRVTEPSYQNQRITGVSYQEGSKTTTLNADYIFATDGRFSVLRKQAGLETSQHPEFFDIVWCKVPVPDFLKQKQTVRVYFGNGQLGLFVPSYDALQIGWIIRKGSYKDFKKKGIAGWIDEMSKFVSPDLATHLQDNKDKISHPFLLDVICDFYPQWSVPGMSLLGDAAHPMSPVGGQGINIALRDAVVAANHFIPLLKKAARPSALDQAAESFAAERSVEVKAIQKLQHRPPRLLLGQGLWLDALTLSIKAAQKTGLSKLFGQNFQLANTAFTKGITEVTLNTFKG